MDQKASKVVIIDRLFSHISANKNRTIRISTLLKSNLNERGNSKHFYSDVHNGEYPRFHRYLSERYIRMVRRIL